MWEPGPDRSLETLDWTVPANGVMPRQVLCNWGLPTEFNTPTPAAPAQGMPKLTSTDELAADLLAAGVVGSANGGRAYSV